jgi:predicted lipoprotein with Yx(FWY)xxD motif
MWMTGLKIVSAVLFSLVVSVGVASAQYNYPTTPQPTQPPSQSTTLNVASAMIAGKSQPILVDVKGMSLYYLTSDTMTSSACTGGCASAWPPLLSDGAPKAPASATGKLAIIKTANGSQVSYNGHLLYRFGIDSKPGEVQGEGRNGPQNGVWHVATPDLKPLGI